MDNRFDDERRALLRRLALGLTLVPLAGIQSRRAHAADLPPLSESDPAAKTLDYVEDVSKAKGAQSGSLCSNCSVYSGADGAPAGPCTLFPGKSVKANGWCKSWSGL
jgi:High potential iron-sulfur protein